MTHTPDGLTSNHHELPRPTIWPAVMAFGITLLAAGVVVGGMVSAGGAVLIAWGAWGWVRELMMESGILPRAADGEARQHGG